METPAERKGTAGVSVQKPFHRVKRVWTCELCGQSVIKRLGSAPILPSGFLENCKLRDHMIGNECIARRDLKAARKLIKE
jgi:hypothetical protein